MRGRLDDAEIWSQQTFYFSVPTVAPHPFPVASRRHDKNSFVGKGDRPILFFDFSLNRRSNERHGKHSRFGVEP